MKGVSWFLLQYIVRTVGPYSMPRWMTMNGNFCERNHDFGLQKSDDGQFLVGDPTLARCHPNSNSKTWVDRGWTLCGSIWCYQLVEVEQNWWTLMCFTVSDAHQFWAWLMHTSVHFSVTTLFTSMHHVCISFMETLHVVFVWFVNFRLPQRWVCCSQCQKRLQTELSFKLSPNLGGSLEMCSNLYSNAWESFKTLPCFREEFRTWAKMGHRFFLSNELSPETLPWFRG